MAGTVDSTGMDVYLVETSVTTTLKSDCTTAIAAGKRIGKVKSLGALGGTRAITENKYLSNDDTEKSVGSVSYANLTVDCPYNPADTAGQQELRDMFDGKTRKKMIIADTDGNFTVVPSVICSGAQKTYALDEFVMFNATIEVDAAYVDVTA